VAAVVYEQFRAALWLVYERWYVGMAVPESGLSASRPCIVWAMCVVWQLFWRVDFFVFVGASRVCSSHSIHGVFLFGFGKRSSRLSWALLGGLCPVVSVLARFPVN
jgi:hypothetical protein